VLFGTVGTDTQSGAYRMTFGIDVLFDGLGFVPISMGIFGLAEIVYNIEHQDKAATISGKVTGREQVRTAAGTFDAIKAELRGRRELTFPPTRDVYNDLTVSQLTYSIWYVPEVGRAVKYERRTFNRAARLLEHEQYELVSYQLK